MKPATEKQLRAFAENCERDMRIAIKNMKQSDKLASDIRRLIDGEVYVVEIGKVPTTSAQPLTCTWTNTYDHFDMPGVYSTSCGQMWSFTDGDLKENEIKFCPYCSGTITASPENSHG